MLNTSCEERLHEHEEKLKRTLRAEEDMSVRKHHHKTSLSHPLLNTDSEKTVVRSRNLSAQELAANSEEKVTPTLTEEDLFPNTRIHQTRLGVTRHNSELSDLGSERTNSFGDVILYEQSSWESGSVGSCSSFSEKPCLESPQLRSVRVVSPSIPTSPPPISIPSAQSPQGSQPAGEASLQGRQSFQSAFLSEKSSEK